MNYRNIIDSKPLALSCVAFVVLVLAACGGGGGSGQPVAEPIDRNCDSTSILDDGVCRTFARRVDERAPTPFTEAGEPVSLEVVLFQPLAGQRFPTIVFNHGSTGNGSDPSRFGLTFTSKSIARYFVERGWMVAFPQRRGRGASDGLYDEGFAPDRSGYSCQRDIALAGAERAMQDVDAVTEWLRARLDVDTTRILIGGTSRGGILSVASVARRPDVYVAAINFVGGWIAEGCGDHLDINRALFESGAGFPGESLWLYGRDDSFYSVDYSRANFEAFTARGGLGEFRVFTRAPGLNGHFLINDLSLWEQAMDQFLARSGL